eukprot:5132719-Prymnesium_polylepis.1
MQLRRCWYRQRSSSATLSAIRVHRERSAGGGCEKMKVSMLSFTMLTSSWAGHMRKRGSGASCSVVVRDAWPLDLFREKASRPPPRRSARRDAS